MRERRLRRVGRVQQAFRSTNDTYDPENVPQYFQISVNVLEARKLCWSNPQAATSYVMVVLGRKKHRTTVRKHQAEPCYREYLAFEMYMSIREIQRSSLWLAVMEPKCYSSPRMLGEATIDLGDVWAQPNHQVYHKWVQLSLPRDPNVTGPVGFLKVDISIIFRGEIQVMPAILCDEKVDEHILFPTGSEQQRAKYLVTIHAAFSLLSNFLSQNDKRFGRPPTTYVRVSFAGLVGTTGVQQRATDPKYSELIKIVEMFPNVNQVIRFEVCSAETSFSRVMASTELRLEVIAHDGDNGFLPVFGPSLLHMYGASANTTVGTSVEDGPFYKGSLLISIKTVVPYYQQNLRTVTVEPVLSVLPDNIWVQEEFCVYCPIFEISMLDLQTIKKITGLAMTIGEVPSAKPVDEEFLALASDLKSRKAHYTGALEVIKTKTYGYIEFRHTFPVLQLATRLPDFRFRMYRNNIVKGIISELEQALTNVEKRLNYFIYTTPMELTDDLNKAVDDAAGNILKYLDIISYSSNSTGSEDSLQQYSTELDHRQLALQKEEIEKIYNQLTNKSTRDSATSILCQQSSKAGTRDSLIGTRRGVKILLAEIKILAENLRNTIYKSPYGWPDIVIWLLNEGTRIAYAKLFLSDIVYSVIPEQCGTNCGHTVQTLYMKPLKCSKHINTSRDNCYCITGKVEILLWMGLFRQRHAFSSFMPPHYHLKHKDLDMHVKAAMMVIVCKAYIYRAKLNTDGSNNLYNTFVRLNALSLVMDTKVKKMSSTPIWNQVLTVNKLMCTSTARMVTDPPFVLVEVYDEPRTDVKDLIGRFQIQPVFDEDPKYVPKLQWYEIYKGAQNTGQILMSVQFLQIQEKLLKSTIYETNESSFHVGSIINENESDIIETLPPTLIPQSLTYKVDVYWWGLRDINIARKPLVVLEIDDLLLKSDVIVNRKPNSNFNNNRATQVFEFPINEDYPSHLCIRLYDSSTFGRTLFLGTNIIRNPSKYMIDWIPKDERESALKSVSIVSSDFCAVDGKMLYVKKNSQIIEDVCSTKALKSIAAYRATTNKSRWSTIFRKKDPPEEELSLLPVYSKIIKKNSQEDDRDDWWITYFESEKNLYEEEREKLSTEVPNITIYDYELELQPEFSKFKDWCTSLKFYNGKKTGIPEKDDQLQCGILKAGIAIYRWPPPQNIVAVNLNGVELDKGFFEEHPSNDNTKYLVRVYVVKALNLSKDFSGKSDPYVMMHCGKRQLGNRNSHVSNTVEAIFGKMYEFSCVLPDDYLLTISVYNFDTMQPDELIGSTTIDLEDRIYSKHRARVGLASEYTLSGPSKWRDSVRPSGILEELCAKNHIPPPIFPDPFSVIVNGVEYKHNSSGSLEGKNYTQIEHKENICLSILNKWQTLPICGYHLVPEHVETRSLYHPDTPGIERGKIQLWVDIFPADSTYIPTPRDITPKKVKAYELRIVVWDVQSLLVGQGCWKTADLYVKVNIGAEDNIQQTDIHYHSTSGEGNFNWRMVFHFLYNHAERKLISKEKGPFTEYEEYLPPNLYVHLMDSKEDEQLGSLKLNLNDMFCGAKQMQQCTLKAMETGKTINMFTVGRIRGWWPFKAIDLNNDKEVPGGAIDLEITLLPQERAVLMPVGTGRQAPSPLPEPARPQPPKEEWKYSISTLQQRGQEVLIFLVIVAVVWLLVYILYWAFSFNDNSFYWFRSNPSNKKYKSFDGILRSISNLET